MDKMICYCFTPNTYFSFNGLPVIFDQLFAFIGTNALRVPTRMFWEHKTQVRDTWESVNKDKCFLLSQFLGHVCFCHMRCAYCGTLQLDYGNSDMNKYNKKIEVG